MKFTWANWITILRILLVVPFVSLMLKANDTGLNESAQNYMRYISIVIFLFIAIGDWADGYLARHYSQITKLGTFLDPVADKLFITCACLLLASKRGGVEGFFLPPTVVVCIIAKDLLLLLGFLIVYFITSKIFISPAFIGKAATFLQLFMVGAILLAPEASGMFPWWIWLLRLLWWSAAVTAILTTLIYIRSGSVYIEKHEKKF